MDTRNGTHRPTPTSTPSATDPAATRGGKRPSRRWVLFIVGLLVGHTALMVAAVLIATADRSFAVDPDYYQKAVHWDRARAERRASEQLGWTATVQTSPADAAGRRAVRFVLTDAAGRAVPGAGLEVIYFHHAHGGHPQQATLSPDDDDPRAFTRVLPLPYAGLWEFRLTATAGGKTFVETLTTTATADPAK